MKISTPQNIDFNTIDTLIFDWGGVITNISPQASVDAFQKLGHPDFGKYFNSGSYDDLFLRFEIGEALPEEIYARLNHEIGSTCKSRELDEALCAMLLDTPEIRLRLLGTLNLRFTLYLLSNTNLLHTNYYIDYLKEKYGIDFKSFFRKVYLSHELGLRKPDVEIYEKLIREEHIDPEKTLFLDDLEINIETARSLGIKTLLITDQWPVERIFSCYLDHKDN
jgi:FMN phosphatase YigB (HAD superfamily)